MYEGNEQLSFYYVISIELCAMNAVDQTTAGAVSGETATNGGAEGFTISGKRTEEYQKSFFAILSFLRLEKSNLFLFGLILCSLFHKYHFIIVNGRIYYGRTRVKERAEK